MRKNILSKLLLVGSFAVAASACTEEADVDSVVTDWATFSSEIQGGPITINECSPGIYSMDFKLSADKQMQDLDIEISVGASSTATEGEDFELVTHDVSLAAFGGQDGFTVEIELFEDFELEDGDETINLVFTSTVPSGLTDTEVLAFTIEDSEVTEDVGQTADFALSWDYTSDAGDVCDFDLDLTFQTKESGAYENDLLHFDAASLACVEEGELTIDEMVDGEVYDIWVYIYAGEDVAKPLTINIDYSRGDVLDGSLTVTGVFDSGMADNAFVVGTIERHCHVLTIKDADGDVIAEGRVGNSSVLKSIKGVKKPI